MLSVVQARERTNPNSGSSDNEVNQETERTNPTLGQDGGLSSIENRVSGRLAPTDHLSRCIKRGNLV
jgi:hypothetical protein